MTSKEITSFIKKSALSTMAWGIVDGLFLANLIWNITERDWPFIVLSSIGLMLNVYGTIRLIVGDFARLAIQVMMED